MQHINSGSAQALPPAAGAPGAVGEEVGGRIIARIVRVDPEAQTMLTESVYTLSVAGYDVVVYDNTITVIARQPASAATAKVWRLVSTKSIFVEYKTVVDIFSADVAVEVVETPEHVKIVTQDEARSYIFIDDDNSMTYDEYFNEDVVELLMAIHGDKLIVLDVTTAESGNDRFAFMHISVFEAAE